MNTKFKRMVAVTMCILICITLFAGCGNNKSDKDEQGRTMVSVGGWPSKEGADLDSKNARKARYEEANPDFVIVPDTWQFDRRTFYAKAAGGQLPTLYNTGFTEVPEILSSDYSSDLTEILKERGYEGMINENILDVVMKDGEIRALPFSSYVLGIAFNTEMMSAAGLMEADGTPKQPKDWYELAEFAVKIKKATGKPGFAFPSSNKNGGWIFTPLAWSFGVDFMEKDADGKWHATFNSPETIEALQYIKDLKWKYDVLPSNTLIDGTEYSKTFATGNAGMIITAGDISKKVVQYGMTPDLLGMMAMPEGPKKHVTLLGGGVFCVNAEATKDQIDGAVRWVETAYSYKLTDELKKNKKDEIEKAISDGMLVGIKSMSPWSTDSESVSYEYQLIDEYANSNPNHVKLYNDFVLNCPAEIRAEEPVCCQELYEILDACIQEVLINKDADCAKLIEKAAKDFQANYLDNLVY